MIISKPAAEFSTYLYNSVIKYKKTEYIKYCIQYTAFRLSVSKILNCSTLFLIFIFEQNILVR